MGNWVIHIEGTGAHHNNLADIDANEKAKEFVHELIGIGQTVESATFTSGSRDDVRPATNQAAA